MIPFDYSRFHRTKMGGIYLSYQQIEELTEMLLQDYNPKLLTDPMAIEYDDFLEGYLGVDLDYQHIYTSGNEGDILGCALFSGQRLAIFDKENMRKSYREYGPNTVVLDLSLIEGDRAIQENITGLHEGGHVWIHGPILQADQHQMTLSGVEFGKTCCSRRGIERFEKPYSSLEESWREWQATTFAVTLALSRKSLEISVPELFDRYGIKGRQMVVDADPGSWELSYHTIPEALGRIYNMSKEAIRYRLEKTGFYITKKKFEEEHAQMTLFDFL